MRSEACLMAGDGFVEILRVEGRLSRNPRGSGPMPPHDTEQVVRTSDHRDDDIRIERLLREHEGSYIRITIEKLAQQRALISKDT